MWSFKSLPSLDLIFDEPEVPQEYKQNYSILYAHNNLLQDYYMMTRRLCPLYYTASTNKVKFLISASSRCRYKSTLFY